MAQVAELPITAWNYEAEDRSVRHIGPTAQDFHAAFGLGESEVAIGTLDADGGALASIQALYERNRELAAENAALRSETESQQAQLDDLEARLSALETGDPRPDRPVGNLLPWAGGLLVAVAGVWTLGRDRLGDLLGGGGSLDGGGFVLTGTLGQAEATTWRGGGYTLSGGFWGGGEQVSAGAYRIYLPLVLRRLQ